MADCATETTGSSLRCFPLSMSRFSRISRSSMAKSSRSGGRPSPGSLSSVCNTFTRTDARRSKSLRRVLGLRDAASWSDDWRASLPGPCGFMSHECSSIEPSDNDRVRASMRSSESRRPSLASDVRANVCARRRAITLPGPLRGLQFSAASLMRRCASVSARPSAAPRTLAPHRPVLLTPLCAPNRATPLSSPFCLTRFAPRASFHSNFPLRSAQQPPAKPAASPSSPSAASNDPVLERIAKDVKADKVVLFMKGTPEQPMCGFSAYVVKVLQAESTHLALPAVS